METKSMLYEKLHNLYIEEQKCIEKLILLTPTSIERNKLTEENIKLLFMINNNFLNL